MITMLSTCLVPGRWLTTIIIVRASIPTHIIISYYVCCSLSAHYFPTSSGLPHMPAVCCVCFFFLWWRHCMLATRLSAVCALRIVLKPVRKSYCLWMRSMTIPATSISRAALFVSPSAPLYRR